jgi:3',5'-cyclic AMP phosphodiesterase CpdA
VQPELKAGEGFRKCLAAVHDLKPRPDLILTGGDLVMDALAHDAARVKVLFDLYISCMKDSDIPIRNCVGNHDVFGWGSRKVASPGDAGYGKKMVQERLDLAKTTYGFDHKGWHFVMVDDIVPVSGEGYEGGVTDEDMAWLETDLKAAGNRPKLIVAHIPFISVAAYTSSNGEPEKPIPVEAGMICRNPGAIMKLFGKHKVNLALTGHLHCNERMEFASTTYIGEGAVCGGWWKGPHRIWPEGFGVVDLRPDGTFEHQYHTYGWIAEKPAKADAEG